MLTDDFCSDFNICLDAGDLRSANYILMKELGNILIRKKKDFVDLLNESGIPASMDNSDVELIEKFTENVAINKKLMLGSALLVQMHNKQLGFDGDPEISDEGVKDVYAAIQSYQGFDDSEDYSNAGGLLGGLLGAGTGIADTILKGQQQRKYGGLDALQKKQEAKQAMLQAVIQQRQAEAERKKQAAELKAKNRKMLYIISGSVLGLAIIGIIIYAVRKGKKK